MHNKFANKGYYFLFFIFFFTLLQCSGQININKIDELSVGDTCYINIGKIGIRGEPSLKSEIHAELYSSNILVVEEICGNKWIRVSHMNQDVGVLGYIDRKYLSKQPILIKEK